MNERLKQLAEQAGIKVGLAPHDKNALGRQVPGDWLEAYAKLIIEDCATICGAVHGAAELKQMHEFAAGAERCRQIIYRDFDIK